MRTEEFSHAFGQALDHSEHFVPSGVVVIFESLHDVGLIFLQEGDYVTN